MAKTVHFLFAHGAGAPSSHPWMVGWAKRLSTLGKVTSFDYPYMRNGKKAPDRLPKLIEAHRDQLIKLRKKSKGPIVLVGKSMGSRVGCHLSLEEEVHGVMCFGYPLVGRTNVRDQVLLDMATPIHFMQGSKDKLCPIDQLQRVRKKMKAPSTLYVVDGGGHGLEVGKRQLKAEGRTQDDVDADVLASIPY